MTQLALVRSRLHAQDTPYSDRFKLSAIPGARWSRPNTAWTYPDTCTAAYALRLAYPQADVDGHVRMLLDEYEVQRQALRFKDIDDDDVPPVPGAKLEPRVYQRRAYWLAHDIKTPMLALDMGTGKSAVVVWLVANLNLKRVLIVCPCNVIPVWPREFAKHTDKRVELLLLDQSVVERKEIMEQNFDLGWKQPLIFVTNHEAVWMDPLGDHIRSREWDLIVVDESHRGKAPGGVFSGWLNKVRPQAERRICLTGTPMPHDPLDIYAQYRFLDPGIFGQSFTKFRARYAYMGGFENKQVVGYQNQQELHDKVYSIGYRVMADDVLDLPETQHIDRTFEMSPKARRIYDEIEDQLITQLDSGVVTASNALVKLLRLSQCVNGFLHTDPDDDHPEGIYERVDTGKRDLLRDLLIDIPPDEPVVVFSRFHRDTEDVFHACQHKDVRRSVCSLRDGNLEAWQNGEFNLIDCQIRAGGVGIDLTRSRYNIYYSLDYQLDNYTQSIKRTHRIGQERKVFYYHLIGMRSIDIVIARALKKREKVINDLLEMGSAEVSEAVEFARDVLSGVCGQNNANRIETLQNMAVADALGMAFEDEGDRPF